MSSRLDWDITRGDTEALAFAVKFFPDTPAESTDITGASVYCYVQDVRRAAGWGSPMSTLTLRNVAAGGAADEIAITNALAGELSVYLTTDDLVGAGLVGEPLELVRLPYSLRVVRADGEDKTCAHGVLIALIPPRA